jgi:hypothetical protein
VLYEGNLEGDALKKQVLVAFSILILFAYSAGVLFVSLTSANPYTQLFLPTITINSDGSITPETPYVIRAGNNYTLTADVIQQYSIKISASDIVFDGAGHTINVAVEGAFSENGYPAAYMNAGLNLETVHNVLVKNVTVFANNNNAINLQFSSNCQITNITTNKEVRILGDFNKVTESNTGVAVSEGSNNVIARNNIQYLFVGVNCFSNRFFQNNFFLSDYPDFFTESSWDNGSVGNYWSNYTLRYPDATELGNSQIGSLPYIIQRGLYTTKEYPNIKSIDHFPLMYPWGAPNVAVFNLENTSYSGSVPLNFSLSKPARWIGYSLDGQSNITLSGNETIEDIPSGFHTVTVYANDTFGYMGLDTFSFKVSAPETFPVGAVAAVLGVLAAAVGVGLIVYYKKRHL